MRVDVVGPELLVHLRQRGDFFRGQVRVDLRANVHATGLAEQLAPDGVAEFVIR